MSDTKKENKKKTSEKTDKILPEEIYNDEIKNQISILKEKIFKAETNEKKSFDQMLRAKAELENYKKRSNRELNDFRKYSLESIMKELITIVDNLERAIDSSKKNKSKFFDQNIVEGITLTLNEMIKLLEKHGVTAIKSIGEIFDPQIHQAMSQEKTSEYPENTIIKEFLKGYLIYERLLRASMVVVSKKPDKQKKDSKN